MSEEEEEAAVAERPTKKKAVSKAGRSLTERAMKGKIVGKEIVAPRGSVPERKVGREHFRIERPRERVVRRPSAPKPSQLDCGVYIGTESPYVAVLVLKALFDYVDKLGIEAWDIQAVEPGSVWVRIKMWAKKVADKRQTRILASQLMQTAEAMTVDKALSENTERYGSSVAALADAMKHADSVVLDLGPLQYAQFKDEDGKIHIRSRALGSKDIAAQRLSDDQLRRPQQVYEMLDADSSSIGVN